MRIGAVFPQTEIGSDPVAIRDYAQAVEAMGYTHILVYDHVVGASTATRPDWRGPYTSDTTFQEPFVLFGYLAGLTSRVELTTGVIILPQRQTSLVAKQTAEIDVLSGGRLRLGVGIGWNPVEFEALNEDFHNRGARIEEQVAVLRALWTEPVVTFQGRWHHIDAAGIKPLPVQQPIPVWFGGSPTEPILRRIARLADGWMPQMPDPRKEDVRQALDQLRAYTREAGRSAEAMGIEARLPIGQVSRDLWATYADTWRSLGATHLGFNTMGAGLTSPQAHIDALAQVKAALGF
ncbi:MAG TPA: LLM class F420-dependent oxidoreductase [Ktedonobacterales bacterium]|nr:LLM class F420-dependent oxidoreductase [Ktedonobacterales bacterium]